jgi:hypothetical protein
MSDTTTTYPTPARDKLAADRAFLEHGIEQYRAARIKYWDEGFTRAQLHDSARELGIRTLPQSGDKATLVAALVEQWDMKHGSRPAAIEELARLERRARIEATILDGVYGNTVEKVDADHKALIASNLDMSVSPEWLAGVAATWQYARAFAVCWRFIGATIDKGKTPIEAAHEAVQYFRREVVQRAAGGAHGRTPLNAAMDAQEQAAFATFTHRLTVLDGLVTPDDV